jgi:hypothetical protein
MKPIEEAIDNYFRPKVSFEQLCETVEEVILTKESQRGFDYEEEVISVLNSVGLAGNITSGAGASATAADADMNIDGNIQKIEVKLDSNAQMGGTSLRYNPLTDDPTERFVIVSDTVDPDTVSLMEEALTPLIPRLNDFLEFVGATKFPATVTQDKWVEAKELGLLRPLNVKIKRTTNFIINHYRKKGINYIQIGGSGLFYLADNPANIPIPQLDGEINIELRPGRSGSKTRKDGTKVVGFGLRVQGRLRFKGKSPFTLDDPESIREMIEARNVKAVDEPPSPEATS